MKQYKINKNGKEYHVFAKDEISAVKKLRDAEFEVGKTYTTKNGNEFTVTAIKEEKNGYGKPETYVYYEFTNKTSGNYGSSKSTISFLRNNTKAKVKDYSTDISGRIGELLDTVIKITGEQVAKGKVDKNAIRLMFNNGIEDILAGANPEQSYTTQVNNAKSQLEKMLSKIGDSAIQDESTYKLAFHNDKWYYEITNDDGSTKLVGPYSSAQEARVWFAKHRPNDKLQDKSVFSSETMASVQEGIEKDYASMRTRLSKMYDFDVKDATPYKINFRHINENITNSYRVSANNVREAIEIFAKDIASEGVGTANINVLSISPNDGYMKLYGKLSDLLKTSLNDAQQYYFIWTTERNHAQKYFNDAKKLCASGVDATLSNTEKFIYFTSSDKSALEKTLKNVREFDFSSTTTDIKVLDKKSIKKVEDKTMIYSNVNTSSDDTYNHLLKEYIINKTFKKDFVRNVVKHEYKYSDITGLTREQYDKLMQAIDKSTTLKDSAIKDKIINVEARTPEDLKKIIQSWNDRDDGIRVKVWLTKNTYSDIYYYHDVNGYYVIPTGVASTTTEYTHDRAKETALKYASKIFDSKSVKDADRDYAIYTLQSDVDKNLTFYIGKKYALKDGMVTWIEYSLEKLNKSPQQLKNELLRNGWHEISNRPVSLSYHEKDQTLSLLNKDSAIKDTKYTIKCTSDEGVYYLVNGWETHKTFWVRKEDLKPEMLFSSPSYARASLTKLLKVMPEYASDKFEPVEIADSNNETLYLVVDRSCGKYIGNYNPNTLRYTTTLRYQEADKFTKNEAEQIAKKLSNYWGTKYTTSEMLDSKCRDTNDKPEFPALGKWEWDAAKQDWWDTKRKMYYTELVRNSGGDFDKYPMLDSKCENATSEFLDSKCKDDNYSAELDKLAKKIEERFKGIHLSGWGHLENGAYIWLDDYQNYSWDAGHVSKFLRELGYDAMPVDSRKVKFTLKNSVKDVEPNKDESKEDFISRFMSETKEEYPDEKQRYAIANSYWERKDVKDSSVGDSQSTYTIKYKNSYGEIKFYVSYVESEQQAKRELQEYSNDANESPITILEIRRN